MSSPEVGESVFFYKFVDEVHAAPLSALIASVGPDDRVNLTVFKESGFPYGQSCVSFVQDGGEVPMESYCAAVRNPFVVNQEREE